jgi:hypothetical protein
MLRSNKFNSFPKKTDGGSVNPENAMIAELLCCWIYKIIELHTFIYTNS